MVPLPKGPSCSPQSNTITSSWWIGSPHCATTHFAARASVDCHHHQPSLSSPSASAVVPSTHASSSASSALSAPATRFCTASRPTSRSPRCQPLWLAVFSVRTRGCVHTASCAASAAASARAAALLLLLLHPPPPPEFPCPSRPLLWTRVCKQPIQRLPRPLHPPHHLSQPLLPLAFVPVQPTPSPTALALLARKHPASD
jgi:hypothetical protein